MMLKRILSLLLVFLLMPFAAGAQPEEEKITVIATLFPQYDFARQIGGEHVQVSMLLPSGTESHSYEPTPRDMAAIQSADLFVYTGEQMEPWSATILSAIDQENLVVVDASSGVELASQGAVHAEHDEHDHPEHDHEHQHELDPHIWLDPTLAAVMVENICQGLCQADPEHAVEYQANAQEYAQKLQELDAAYQEMVDSAQRKYLVFGGRFSYGYLIRRYGLEYDCAYDSCSSASEPSVKIMAMLIQQITENGVPAVYHEELAATTVTDALCEQTGAKKLLLHSAHNLSAEEMEQGRTYLDIMYGNLENLREGLN